MKKLLYAVVCCLLMLYATVYAQNEPVTEIGRFVYIDSVYTGISATEIDGTEYLPVKALCEVLGYSINEITENVYLIGEGENCKNSESSVKSVKFTLGEDYVISYSKDGQYENKIETFPSEPITVKIGDEIYMPSFYFGRMLEIKMRFTTDNKTALITLNEQKEQMANAPERRGYITVKNHDDYLEIEVDRAEMTFTDKPFIDAEGRVQVPVREFCEQLNFGVTWFENPGRVSVSSVPSDLDKSNGGSAGGASVWFTIGERQYRINGTYYDMDTEAQIINDRTYVPMRYLAEALNYYVAYNPSSPANLDMGYGYKVLNSYLGLERDLVFREAEIDESFMLKTGNDDFPIREHDEGNMYIIKNGYKKGDVVLEFYNDVLCAFHYVFKTEGEAFEEALDVYDYFVKLYGEADTYPNIQKTIGKIGADEGQFNDEVCSYYDEWIVDAPSEVIETLLGEADNGLMKTVRMDINPKMSVVRVNYSKDVNFHNRSLVKIIDKDNNYIITDEDIIACAAKFYPRPEDGPSAAVVQGVVLELKITDKARQDLKEATNKISAYPDGENFIKCLIDGAEVSAQTVRKEIDSDEILINGTLGDYEKYKSYSDTINERIKH